MIFSITRSEPLIADGRSTAGYHGTRDLYRIAFVAYFLRQDIRRPTSDLTILNVGIDVVAVNLVAVNIDDRILENAEEPTDASAVRNGSLQPVFSESTVRTNRC